MTFDLTLVLLIAATAVTGLLAGASLDKAIVQLPACHRMGMPGFAAFSRANDLGNGLIAYPVMGISAAVLSVFLQGVGWAQGWPVYLAGLLAVLHSFTTARAAPIMLALRQPTEDESSLAGSFNRFAAWHNLRAALQVLNFVVLIWAVVSY